MPDPDPISLSSIRLSIAAITEAFAEVKDHRRDHLKRFPLPDILVLVVAGMLTGCEDWVDIEDFGEDRAEWFQAQGLFAQGTPSHDTLGRVFRVLDANVLRACFAGWVQRAMGTLSGVIAIDGKTSRGTADGKTRGAIHTVSAFASQTGLTLAHVAVAEKSNGITAIPVLLEMLALKGCTVTIDAMGCQKDIATCIRQRGGDYLLQVKANQPATLNDLRTFFFRCRRTQLEGHRLHHRPHRQPRPWPRRNAHRSCLPRPGTLARSPWLDRSPPDPSPPPHPSNGRRRLHRRQLLHHQRTLRRRTPAQHGPPTLGHRSTHALDPRRRLQRRPPPSSQRQRRP